MGIGKKDIYIASAISRRIVSIMLEQRVREEDVVRRIKQGSSKKVKRICTISTKRMLEITKGATPTFMETYLISQALGKELVDLLPYLNKS